MTEARVRPVPADRMGAREFLDQARLLLDDAALDDVSNEGRQILVHHAAISACDAVLLACGLQVTAGDGAHVLRLERALDRLPGDIDLLLDDLDSSRAMRVQASYRAGTVAGASVDEAEGGDTGAVR